MQRIIPKNTKVKISFWRGLTVADICVGLFVLLLFALSISTNIVLGIFVLCILSALFFNVSGERIYTHLFHLGNYAAEVKAYSVKGKKGQNIQDLTPISGISENYITTKSGNVCAVIEISPIEYRLIDEIKQDDYVNIMARALRAISAAQQIEIVRIEKRFSPLPFQKCEIERLESAEKMRENKRLTDIEYLKRYDIANDRLDLLDRIKTEFPYIYNAFYILITGKDKGSVKQSAQEIISVFNTGKINTEVVTGDNLTRFVKKLKLPQKQVKFNLTNTVSDNKQLSNFIITNYPLQVQNAWAADIFDIPNTRVVLRLKAVDKDKAIKRIDNAIIELAGRKRNKASKAIANETHIDTLSDLLESLQNDNETLFDVTLTLTAFDSIGKTETRDKVRQILRNGGFGFSELFAQQSDVNLTSLFQEPEKLKFSRGLTSELIGASFPFISNAYIDDNGILIGENELPVFFNPWKRDDEHVNSNIIVVGKTGSGKTYFAKTLLAALATDNARIFMLDPENEYARLAEALGGETIDISSSAHGVINPLEIMRSMDDGGAKSAYAYHLQFLEEFFKLAMPGLDSDSFELLNNLVAELYRQFGISENSDFQTFESEKFPIFDNLCRLVEDRLKNDRDSTKTVRLQTVSNYLAKFGSGGRFSDIWNGHTTFSADANFINFNFQKLFANKNKVVANAQMLLIFKWLENEVMLNRDRNAREDGNGKIVVALDEAHLFVDEKRPVALDFMCQMAKRIRKYGGMQIVITQSLKDFTGSPETAKKAMAVVNASQYSFIFSLPPSDLNDLCELYDKAGHINEREQYCITHNSRGCAFFISSPERRTNLQIVATPKLAEIIESKQRSNQYENRD